MTSGAAYFLDACVPVYAAGDEHPYKAPCARIVVAIADGEIEAATDTEVIQELVYRYHSIGRQDAGLRIAGRLMSIVGWVLPVTRQDADLFLGLSRTYPSLRPRDAIHVAVMIGAGIERIVTADRHFDQVREVQRVDPLDLKW